jgi:quercetin dioxygenase-like cupin family protein
MALQATTPQTVFENHTDAGEWLRWMPGERFSVRMASAETDGRYTTIEFVATKEAAVPFHIHRNEDEHFLLLEGKMRFFRGDEVIDASAGETVRVPKGVPHGWAALSDEPCRILITFAPGGIDEAFRALAAAGPDQIAAIADRYGVTLV